MAHRYIAAIDCGSSNVRCIIFDIDTGKCVSSASSDWYALQDDIEPGSCNFPGDENWSLICKCTNSALSSIDPSDVVAVATSGFRHSIFCTDKDGELVYGCFNMDSRLDVESLQQNGLEEKVFHIAGDWPAIQGLPRLLWLRKNKPHVFEKADKFMTVSAWVAFKLSGNIAIEPNDASSTIMMDVKSVCWSEFIRSSCAFDKGIYPDIVPAGTIIGSITGKASKESGFNVGTKVVCGIADTSAGITGIGGTNIGDSAIIGGTYWLDCHVTDTPITDPECRTRISCHSTPNQWIYEGLGFYVGLAVRWFRNVFGTEEIAKAREMGLSSYTLLDELTKSVPAGSFGLQVLLADVANQRDFRMCTPTFMGWDILDESKSHKGVFFKAILENACYQALGEYKNISRILGKEDIPDCIMLSGGAAQSEVWSQILCDVLGKQVYIPVEREGTAMGAALYASVGCGFFSDVNEAAGALIPKGIYFEPNMRNHDIYLNEFFRWRKLYKNGLDVLSQGLVKSMFQPESTLSDTQRRNPWKLR